MKIPFAPLLLAAVLAPAPADATLQIDFSSPEVCRPISAMTGPDPYLYSISLYGHFPAVRQGPHGLQTDDAALRAATLTVTQPGRTPERIPYDPRLAIDARLPSFALAKYGEPAHVLDIVYDVRRWCRTPGTMKIHLELAGESANFTLPILAPAKAP